MTQAAIPPSTDEERAYNRGWADGSASALDACDPIIDKLNAQLREAADRAAGPLTTVCRNCHHPKSDHGDDKAPQWERLCWWRTNWVECPCPGWAVSRPCPPRRRRGRAIVSRSSR